MENIIVQDDLLEASLTSPYLLCRVCVCVCFVRFVFLPNVCKTRIECENQLPDDGLPRDPDRLPGGSEDPGLPHGAHLGVPPRQGRRLHLVLPPRGAADAQGRPAAAVVSGMAYGVLWLPAFGCVRATSELIIVLLSSLIACSDGCS